MNAVASGDRMSESRFTASLRSSTSFSCREPVVGYDT